MINASGKTVGRLSIDLAAFQADTPTLAQLNPSLNSVRYIAHRGLSQTAPENTVPAYVAAGVAGFWGAETDVQITSDGVWVLMHDLTVDRTTNGSGNVADLTYAQIQALTIDLFADYYPNTKVPTFEEYLVVCKKYGMVPVIELKEGIYSASDYDSLVAHIKKYNFEEKCIVISGGLTYLQEIRTRSKRIVLHLVTTISDASIAAMLSLKNAGLTVLYTEATKVLIEQAHSNGIQVSVWTVNLHVDAKVAISNGVDYITTDRLRWVG